MSENKKYYSFMGIHEAITTIDGEDGPKKVTYKHIYLDGTASQLVQRHTTSGKTVLSGRIPINEALGTHFNESDDAVWASINFWGNTGERLGKYLNGRDKIRLLIEGRIEADPYTDRNNQAREGVKITVFDWTPMYTSNDSDGAGSKPAGQQSYAQQPAQQAPANVAKTGQFSTLEDFDDDGELPF